MDIDNTNAVIHINHVSKCIKKFFTLELLFLFKNIPHIIDVSNIKTLDVVIQNIVVSVNAVNIASPIIVCFNVGSVYQIIPNVAVIHKGIFNICKNQDKIVFNTFIKECYLL